MTARALLLPLALALAIGCGSGDQRIVLRVYAAASLRDVLVERAEAFETARPDARIEFNFGGSGDLCRQILAARKADLFLSAGLEEIQRLEREGLVAGAGPIDLLRGRLVVVEPSGMESLFTTDFSASALAGDELEHLSIAHPEIVPAGRYAKEWLQSRGVWASVESKVAPASDVRAALAAVESGAARAGIVYASDLAITSGVRRVHEIPSSEGPVIRYPAAVLVCARKPALAEELLRFLTSRESGSSFERHGFELPRRGD